MWLPSLRARSSSPIVDVDAVDEYLEQPLTERTGIGLCLSGGGFRAALFHLGALRRLNELGILARLSTITSVSGGSIIAAHLASRVTWPVSGQVAEWERQVAAPFRAFASHNLRSGPILHRLWPWNWARSSTGAEALAKVYEERLTDLPLSRLPERPMFVVCAADMAFGVNWVFQRTRMGDYQAGYVATPSHDWPLARAVAASSAFPPVFNPLPVDIPAAKLIGGKFPSGTKRDAIVRGLRLTDGGVYDNLGLEPVWKDHAVVLVSDAGAVLNPEPDRNVLWRIRRYSGIVRSQARALRKRWLISSFLAGVIHGAYWGIRGAATSYDQDDSASYSKRLATEVIARIRTDMDAFSAAEAAVLENHGYVLADAAVKKHVPELVPEKPPPRDIPHPTWLDEGRVREALRDSAERRLLGRW
jgi:NTE family protein